MDCPPNGLLTASQTSAMGSLGVQPGPGYVVIDRRVASFIGVWLDGDTNNLAGVLLSIFSTADKQRPTELAV
jgi:hypothetical protein